jgi:hypothetical protein
MTGEVQQQSSPVERRYTGGRSYTKGESAGLHLAGILIANGTQSVIVQNEDGFRPQRSGRHIESFVHQRLISSE